MNVRVARSGRISALALAAVLTCLAHPPIQAGAAPAPRGKAAAVKTTPGTAAVAPKVKGILEPVNVKEDIRLDSVFFITPELGYVSGEAGSIFKTTDGGESWTALLGGDPKSEEKTVEKLRFFDDRHGWAIQYNKLIRTTDGETWEEIGPAPSNLLDYVFVSETTGFATGGNIFSPTDVFKTTNAGKTWKQVFRMQAKVEMQGLTKEASVRAISIHFPTETTGYVVGGNTMNMTEWGPPLIAKTEDGGETWSIWLGPGDPVKNAIVRAFFVDETNGFVVLKEAKVFSTSDGGQTWRGLVGSPSRDLTFADPEVGWSYDGFSLTYTVDGGRHWASRQISLPASARAISMPRRDRVYIAGDHGMVYRYRTVPIGYDAPLIIDVPLMPGFDTSLDREAEALETEVAALEENLKAEGGTGGGAAGADVSDQDESDDVESDEGGESGESAAEDEGDDETAPQAAAASVQPQASAGTAWSPQKYNTRLQRIQASLAAVSADIPKFQGKLRNLNLILFGLQLLNDLSDQSVSAETALAAFRSARDANSAREALADLSRAAHAIVTTTRTAFHGAPKTP